MHSFHRRWLVLSLLVVLFLGFRFWTRMEPLNSDDLVLFHTSARAAQGQHWITYPPSKIHQIVEGTRRLKHQELRVGILPVAVPVIWVLGAHAPAYYLAPLIFAVLGFLTVWWIMDREVHPLVALAFSLVHIVFAFEIKHASNFLVDLPAAVGLLGCLFLVDGAGKSTRHHVWIRSQPAALAGLTAYFLRFNSLVLLAPGLITMAFGQRTRRPALWTGIWIGFGVLAEQAVLMWKGLGFGFRWATVNGALARYSPHLPIYSWGEFIFRGFRNLFKVFGSGIDGGFAVVFLILALLAHLWMVLRAKSVLLRAVSVTGLATWAVFSFAVYERVEGGVRALAPPSFRYFQFFFYSSIVALAWATAQLVRLYSERRELRWRESKVGSATLPLLFALVIPAVFGVFHARISLVRLPGRLSAPCNRTSLTLCSVDKLARESLRTHGEILEIHGRRSFVRQLGLFRGPWSDPPVRWRYSKSNDLGEIIRSAPRTVFLDQWQLLDRTQFLPRNRRRQERVAMRFLRKSYVKANDAPRYHLLVRPRADDLVQLLPTKVVSGQETVKDSSAPVPAWRASVPLEIRKRAQGIELSKLPRDRRVEVFRGPRGVSKRAPFKVPGLLKIESSNSYVLRVDAKVQAGIQLWVKVVELDGSGDMTRKARYPIEDGGRLVVLHPQRESEWYRISFVFSVPGSLDGPADILLRSAQLARLQGKRSGLCSCAENDL